MISLPKFITSRSTLIGFTLVLLLGFSLVVMLLVQIDTWSQAGFDLVNNNSRQARLVLTMRDAVQKRELAVQRMMNMPGKFDRDQESVSFYNLAADYASAREQLYETELDPSMLESLKQLDEAVDYAQPYHNNLVEALIFEDIKKSELDAIIQEGRKGSAKVLFLLDKVVELQGRSYEKVIAEYKQSRQYTLLGVIGVFTLISVIVVIAIRASSKQFRQISRLSIIDEVSGTYNRRYFDMVLEEEWKRSMREYTPISLLMLDIDFFKEYNDTFGHQMGDVCLYTVGKILAGQLKRSSDFTARYGGEEFAIVLPNTKAEHARLLAERLRRSVEEARIKAGKDLVSPWVTVSIGVATTTAEYEQSSASLIKAADKCLYDSKRNGRNRVCDRLVDDLN